MKKLLIIIALTTLAGCAGQRVQYVIEPLPVPPEPELPKVMGEELACLSDDAYGRLVKRDVLQQQDRALLRDILRSTHPDGDR